ncbi:MAG: GerMN domain-containing protein [Bacilli bacterium]|nr:GerMN domain-containing protein [Bacilli bacterium]
MLKKAIKKRIIITFMTLFIILIIYLIPVNKNYEKTITLNKNVNYVYLLNNKNMLIRANVIGSNSNQDILNKVKEIVDSLTVNSKTSNYINDKLKPIIPENTKVLDLSLNDNILKINFSKELLNINEKLEEKLIESLVYSITEIDRIKNLMIFVDGNSLTKLPHSNKSLPILLNRDYGINKVYDITTISNTSKYTIYYYTNIEENYNAVPVTIFTNNSDDKIEVIIKNLKSSNIYQSDLVSFLSTNTKLLDYEIKENKIKLNFNQYLLDTFYDDSLIEEVKYAISNSIKDSLGINEIDMLVNGKKI